MTLVLLTGVSLFVQQAAPSGRLAASRRIEAAEARLTPGAWRLSDARESAAGSELERSEQLSIPSTLDRASAMEKFISPAAVPVWRLPGTVRAARAAGYAAARYKVRWQQLLAMPLMLGAMTLLAASVSLPLTRLGQLPLLCATGVAGGFAVFFLDSLCGSLGSAEILPPLVAAWSSAAIDPVFRRRRPLPHRRRMRSARSGRGGGRRGLALSARRVDWRGGASVGCGLIVAALASRAHGQPSFQSLVSTPLAAANRDRASAAGRWPARRRLLP